ncbi:uncharacterized protein LOC127870795 [Dreissena polymorpha]|uniref:N-acetyltransferase domain-containing protein n=1 Tax=Dreissena polymorpha TaxID=45954 RepID=A0A9D4LAA6_DREPO|nr:uncharacterized protein LOC127870795 [Dreissena polymorpha]KAH3854466.1 hypothetical protein DPMN_097008 [Dreissena polymorpha]
MESSFKVRNAKDGDENCINEDWVGIDMTRHKANVAQDPKYLMVTVDENDEAVGYGGITHATPDIFYLGNFIVREDLRGKGIGKLIWQALIERAGNRNIALDAVSYTRDWYENNGFKFSTSKVAYFNVCVNEAVKKSVQSEYTCRDLTEDLWPMMVKYDRQVYPTLNRERILRACFCVDSQRAVVALHSNQVVGYGSIHEKPHQEYELKNVFADDEGVVEAMLRELFKDVPEGRVVHFEKIEGKPMPKYLERSDSPFDFSGIRMYNKYPVETIGDKMWLSSATIL